MKLVTFKLDTPVGTISRLGIMLSGKAEGTVADANFAYAAMAAEKYDGDAAARAEALCPPSLSRMAEIYGPELGPLREVQSWIEAQIAGGKEITGADGQTVLHALSGLVLAPPVDRVPVLRDFAAFEDHLRVTFGKMGIRIPDAWYNYPMAFKGNASALVGPEEEVVWPAYTEKFDYELEIAAVIGRAASNISVDSAGSCILGYTLLNDFSARDIQSKEMSNSTGPFKAKDFAWGLGPCLVTPDELGDPSSVKMSVRVNGETWAESTPGEMQWSFPEIIAYTSQSERLNVGDVFGSGTVNHGCGFEIERWVKPGDTVELTGEGIGVLRNTVAGSKDIAITWRDAKRHDS